jgi:hypothetical protein
MVCLCVKAMVETEIMETKNSKSPRWEPTARMLKLEKISFSKTKKRHDQNVELLQRLRREREAVEKAEKLKKILMEPTK